MNHTQTKPLSGSKVALLIAGGFCEQDITATQRILLNAGAQITIVSPDQGLVNGWDGKGWGHHYMVDAPLSTALGADFDMLLLPGGTRSMDRLKTTAHTNRFISSFIGAGKPIAVMGDALHLLVITDNVKTRTVTGPAAMQDVVTQAGGLWNDASLCLDGSLLTGNVETEENRENLANAMLELFTANAAQMDQAA
ncbi:MAG: DJ-1/PfpI family protein [Alphaproteobacteria bacterium]|nr:DJ-1/PfpI family protein [Alphaproteobacteria bacterium]